ncbi:hypothetical protein BH24DEI2_BH24DEI2_06740 [soil metagenome]
MNNLIVNGSVQMKPIFGVDDSCCVVASTPVDGNVANPPPSVRQAVGLGAEVVKCDTYPDFDNNRRVAEGAGRLPVR